MHHHSVTHTCEIMWYARNKRFHFTLHSLFSAFRFFCCCSDLFLALYIFIKKKNLYLILALLSIHIFFRYKMCVFTNRHRLFSIHSKRKRKEVRKEFYKNCSYAHLSYYVYLHLTCLNKNIFSSFSLGSSRHFGDVLVYFLAQFCKIMKKSIDAFKNPG